MLGFVYFFIAVLVCVFLYFRLKISKRKLEDLKRKLEDITNANRIQIKTNSVLNYDNKRLIKKNLLIIEDVQKREENLLAKAHEIELDKIDHEAMLERFKNEAEMMQAEVNALHTREDELLEQIKQFRGSIKQLKKENRGSEKVISDFQDYTKKLEKAVSNLQSHNSRLQMRLSVLPLEGDPLSQKGALLELDKTFNFKYLSNSKNKSREPWIELDID